MTNPETPEPLVPEPMLTPAQVAKLFDVDPKTVTRWAATGKLHAFRTPGGHRRFRESEVRKYLRGSYDNGPGPR